MTVQSPSDPALFGGSASAGSSSTLSNGEGLLAIFLYQQARRANLASGPNPTPKTITNWRPAIRNGIRRENRGVSFRLYAWGIFMGCLFCSKPLLSNSDGDHVVALSEGGPDGAQNYLPLCPACNSSKNARDFIDWWVVYKQRSIGELPLDALVMYCRVRFQKHERDGTLEQPAPPALRETVDRIYRVLPDDRFRRSFKEATCPPF